MPLMQVRQRDGTVLDSKRMFTPKKIQRLDHWLRAARKVSKKIPEDATVVEEHASVTAVRFDLKSSVGDLIVHIDRTVRGGI